MTLNPMDVISINPIAIKGELTVAQKKYERMPKRKANTMKHPVIRLLIWQ